MGRSVLLEECASMRKACASCRHVPMIVTEPRSCLICTLLAVGAQRNHSSRRWISASHRQPSTARRFLSFLEKDLNCLACHSSVNLSRNAVVTRACSSALISEMLRIDHTPALHYKSRFFSFWKSPHEA